MALILGIETSCDETAAAVYDDTKQRLLSSHLYSQTTQHLKYGGVVPEIASRTQLERIDGEVATALEMAGVSIDDIDIVAVTNRPGLLGSLLVGVCFAKGMAWASGKKLIGINHHEGHIYSSFLHEDGRFNSDVPFPHFCLTVSGGHTSLYLVHDFGKFDLLGHTLDDAAGEAFDKIARLLGYPYPGGPAIEKLAREVQDQDFFSYPRNKMKETYNVSFSGLKTAVVYDLIKRGAYDFERGVIAEKMTHELKTHVASSLQVCIADIFIARVKRAFKAYPDVKACTFVGGVAANQYIGNRLSELSERYDRAFFVVPKKFSGDNGAMIAFVGSFKATQGQFSDFSLDASPASSTK